MSTYTLTATGPRGGADRVLLDCPDDGAAAWAGLLVVLDRAMTSARWARGSIVLADEHGRVVQQMPAKDT